MLFTSFALELAGEIVKSRLIDCLDSRLECAMKTIEIVGIDVAHVTEVLNKENNDRANTL